MKSAVATGCAALLDALSAAGIHYAFCGSVASSMRGNYRYPSDIDLLVALTPAELQQFTATLPSEFVALDHSLIHTPSAFKFDVFPATGHPFTEAQIHRSTTEQTDLFGPVSVISPEDILLAKLHWFHLGGETSEQQWKDITALLAIQGPNLDREYIQSWSEELQITHLLNRLSLLP